MSTFPNLDVLDQQLLGEMLQRHGSILQAVSQPAGEGDMEGVAGEGLGVEVLKGFEDVVDGMPNCNIPCDYLKDLASNSLEGCSIHHLLLPGTTPSVVVVHNVAGWEDVLTNYRAVSVVVDDTALSQRTEMSLESCAHHLTVNHHHFFGNLLGCSRAFIL